MNPTKKGNAVVWQPRLVLVLSHVHPVLVQLQRGASNTRGKDDLKGRIYIGKIIFYW
jgi:hypothetical protein